MNTNLILKDVGTTFGVGNTLQTHTGKVVSYANETHRLTVDTTPTNRLTLEQTGTFNDALRQENIGFAGIGEQQHGPVNQKYSVLDEVDDGILIDNHIENGLQIKLENETGHLRADDFEAREFTFQKQHQNAFLGLLHCHKSQLLFNEQSRKFNEQSRLLKQRSKTNGKLK